MRTKANIKGHAIHQMLIPFPIGLLIGGFIFDLLGFFYADKFFAVGYYMIAAGIIFALIAAVPGFIDFLFSVPPESTGKKRAVKHLSVNLISVGLFLAAVLIRSEPLDYSPSVLLIETAGTVFLSIGGWMGGTLVNRNFIGPDHRYAQSGKWKEISFYEDKPLYEIASTDELNVNQMKLVRIKGKRIVLSRTEEGWFAFDDRCTHRGGSLAGGVMVCSTVQCLWHGSQFNVKTGEVKSGPAKERIKTYELIIDREKVMLKY